MVEINFDLERDEEPVVAAPKKNSAAYLPEKSGQFGKPVSPPPDGRAAVSELWLTWTKDIDRRER